MNQLVFKSENNQVLTEKEANNLTNFIKLKYPSMGKNIYLCREPFGGFITNGELIIPFIDIIDSIISYAWEGNVYEALEILHLILPNGRGFLYYSTLSSIFEHHRKKERIKSKDQKTYILFDKSSGLYKIGKSSDVLTRIKTHKCSNLSAYIIAIADRNIESLLHSRLKSFKIHGEWYKMPKEVIDKVIISYGFNRIHE